MHYIEKYKAIWWFTNTQISMPYIEILYTLYALYKY